MQAATDSFDIEKTSVTHPDTSAETQARPLLIWRHARKQGAVIYKPLRPNTIAKYFDNAFLANVHHRDKPLRDAFKAHSVRNAVASALAAMGVPAASISALTLNSAATLEQTYIVPVDRDWAIPQACVDAQELLPAKLLLPFVHFDSTTKGKRKAKTCGCSKLLQ